LEPNCLLECNSVSIGYKKRVLIPGISFDIKRGDFLALVGPNGAGKTTLIHTLMGIVKPLAGVVRVRDDLRIGYVPQRGVHDQIFPLSVLDVVRGGGGSQGSSRFSLGTDKAARAALESVGLAAHSERLFRELSGGQQQRVLLARALARDPDIWILDEPTAGLDVPTEKDLMELVEHLSTAKKVAVVLVTHQLWLAARHAKKIGLLNSERSTFSMDDVGVMMTDERLSELFGRPITVRDATGHCGAGISTGRVS